MSPCSHYISWNYILESLSSLEVLPEHSRFLAVENSQSRKAKYFDGITSEFNRPWATFPTFLVLMATRDIAHKSENSFVYGRGIPNFAMRSLIGQKEKRRKDLHIDNKSGFPAGDTPMSINCRQHKEDSCKTSVRKSVSPYTRFSRARK